MDLKGRISADRKQAMRDRDQIRLGTLRLLLAAIQRREIDERVTLDSSQVLSVIEKLIKQGGDSIAQFAKGGRQDLVDKENKEIAVLKAYLPAPLSDAEVDRLIDQALMEADATAIKDMGKVMVLLKSKLQGRADMGKVSGEVRNRLST